MPGAENVRSTKAPHALCYKYDIDVFGESVRVLAKCLFYVLWSFRQTCTHNICK